MVCFRFNEIEDFIFLLKFRQRKDDLNTSKKSLVFVTIRHRKFYLYVQLLYTKISYLCKNKHLQKDAAILHFLLKESSGNIFTWNTNIQKLTKIWSFLPFSQIFVKRKFFFSCSVKYVVTNRISYHLLKYKQYYHQSLCKHPTYYLNNRQTLMDHYNTLNLHCCIC